MVHQSNLRGGKGAGVAAKVPSTDGTLFNFESTRLADYVASLTAGDRGVPWNSETYWTLQTGLYFGKKVVLFN